MVADIRAGIKPIKTRLSGNHLNISLGEVLRHCKEWETSTMLVRASLKSTKASHFLDALLSSIQGKIRHRRVHRAAFKNSKIHAVARAARKACERSFGKYNPRLVEALLDNRFRPFCAERCTLIDLAAWANESYRIPVAEPAEEIDDETPKPPLN